MVSFPNAKINLGLNIVEKRNDGYHNIETVFYPINWCDSLEIIENKANGQSIHKCNLHTSGIKIEGDVTDNLIIKAYDLLSQKKEIPELNVYLHKAIPMGAGLGGGSSDAAHFISLLNQQFNLGIAKSELIATAEKLGSDCAFFMENKPVYATGKGDQFEPVSISLKGYRLVVIFPGIHSNTKLAYSRVKPQKPGYDLQKDLAAQPVDQWKNFLKNDFEESVFFHFPEIKELKDYLYENGATYASLSGSGSSVFALFPLTHKQQLNFKEHYKVCSFVE